MDLAIKDFEKVTILDPIALSEAFCYLFKCMIQKLNIEKAIHYLKQALSNNPKNKDKLNKELRSAIFTIEKTKITQAY